MKKKKSIKISWDKDAEKKLQAYHNVELTDEIVRIMNEEIEKAKNESKEEESPNNGDNGSGR